VRKLGTVVASWQVGRDLLLQYHVRAGVPTKDEVSQKEGRWRRVAQVSEKEPTLVSCLPLTATPSVAYAGVAAESGYT
jgi:hypothetical protein